MNLSFPQNSKIYYDNVGGEKLQGQNALDILMGDLVWFALL